MTDFREEIARALRAAFGDLGVKAAEGGGLYVAGSKVSPSAPVKKRWAKTPRKTVFVGEDAPTSHADYQEADLNLKVQVYSDGTHTEAQIVDKDDDDDATYLARGIALRRKGERRDQDLANSLAVSRAFEDLAALWRAPAEDRLK
ncbi:hypothetical protein ACFWPU_00645 [Streptomyces sp. NPDC058471]|uniref:hypothetical protein n=1 Tax=Streptomyces sp. NPDC058471 TaxID=3346516 RepID=UPI003669E753